jgi:peptide deformylase
MKSSPSHGQAAARASEEVVARKHRRHRLSLVLYPNAVLRTVCLPVETFDHTLRDLVQEMFELMRTHSGIGLAGPQVAIPQRVLVCEIEGRQWCLTNPEVQATGAPGWFTEGCLSLPGVRVAIHRLERIRVTGYDTRGQRRCFGATGLWARVIQHELDHLNGVLISDYGPPVVAAGPAPQVAWPASLVGERKRVSLPRSAGVAGLIHETEAP